MGKIKKKYESGEASMYLTRKQALQKLQLSLKAFRRLCILKGIYPREPKNRKRAQKGATDKKTLYLKKDIQFLLHEPILWTLREHKVFMRKKARARALRDHDGLQRVLANRPVYKLDHIIRERYPTFVDAIRDLDDCLTLCFLFSTFPSMRYVPASLSHLSRRLTVEFMHYVIEVRALRKVFVSVKGYYFQADIKGEQVTWIVPHNFAFMPQRSDDVDFRVMATFVEFYSTLLGFINFRLFHSLNLFYPPKLSISGESTNSSNYNSEEELVMDRVAALNQSLQSTDINSEQSNQQEFDIDDFSSTSEDAEKVAQLKRENERINFMKNMFRGMKIFLSREVPRESLTFVIRAMGGQVSWDSNLFPGALFPESDETITHQIVDRDSLTKQTLSRHYVQPQWVFDCLNARSVLPVQSYFPNAVLPPHLSPFPTEREGDYLPPEKRKFMDIEKGIIAPSEGFSVERQGLDEESDDTEEESEEDEDNSGIIENPDEAISDESDTEESHQLRLKRQMRVTTGQAEVDNELERRENETKEQWRLRCMMIKNKHKRLYKRMMESRRRRRKEAEKLTEKRRQVTNSHNKQKKKQRKAT